MAKRGYGLKEGKGLDEIHDALGIRAGDRQVGLQGRRDAATNDTDTEVSDHSGRWKTLTSKLGRAGHMAHGHFKKH